MIDQINIKKYLFILFLFFQFKQLYCLQWDTYFNKIGESVYIIVSNVNFREKPNLNTRILGRLQSGHVAVVAKYTRNDNYNKNYR